MTDWYEDYYRQSRGYNWNDMRELSSQPRRPSTSVPDCYKDRFSTPAEYDEWLVQKHKDYFG